MKNRPLSPHLSIYKPQITSVLSILHRMTGACLYVGLLALSWLMILILAQSLSMGFAAFDFSIILNHFLFKLMLLGMVFALYYHLCNGIRHLCWDAGLGINNKAVQLSGIAVIMSSGLLTLITYFVASYNQF